MTRPARDTTAGRVYLDLQRKARAEARGTDEMLVLYVLERFLYRLSISEFRDRFVLKGGMLLAAFDERRPTRDVDLLGLAITNDADSVTAVMAEIAAIKVDGVIFRPDQLTTRMIREQDIYAAVRVAMPASVATAALALKVDVNVGDPVTPGPVEAGNRPSGRLVALHRPSRPRHRRSRLAGSGDRRRHRVRRPRPGRGARSWKLLGSSVSTVVDMTTAWPPDGGRGGLEQRSMGAAWVPKSLRATETARNG
jgi:hypothetical protein